MFYNDQTLGNYQLFPIINNKFRSMNQSTIADYRSKTHIIISSTLASIFSTITTNPIEVAKLNRQYLITTCPQFPHQNYRQIVQCGCGKFSIQNSFKGLKVAIPQSVFSGIIYMQIYQHLREKLRRNIDSNAATNFISAIVSRFCVTTVMLPLQSLRVRLGNLKQNVDFKGTSGLKVTLIRDLIFSGLFWTSMQATRNYLYGDNYRQKFEKQKSVSKIFISNLLPGIINGTLIAALTTPLDTVKTRIQSDSKQMPIIKSMVEIYKSEGYVGLFSGIQLRMVKVGLHTTIYLMIYESMMRHIKNQH